MSHLITHLAENPVAAVLLAAATLLVVGGIAKAVAGRRSWRATRGGEHR